MLAIRLLKPGYGFSSVYLWSEYVSRGFKSVIA